MFWDDELYEIAKTGTPRELVNFVEARLVESKPLYEKGAKNNNFTDLNNFLNRTNMLWNNIASRLENTEHALTKDGFKILTIKLIPEFTNIVTWKNWK